MTFDEAQKSLESAGTDAANSREMVAFHRRSELPGVEIRCLNNSARAFRAYSTEFEFFAPVTWHGELWHRRRQAVMGPGTVLCAHPGEVFLARRVIAPGAGNFLTIDAHAFREYLSSHPRPSGKLQLRAFTKMSKLLQEKLLELIRVVRPGPSGLRTQSALVEFVQAISVELLEEGGSANIDAELHTAERVRECLHYDSAGTLDLSTLAREAGVSRYQALRMFKRRYGLPPHTYQLSLRVALAQKALREGQQPVQVAAQYGFVDQSHFTRHFKRLLGVTPAQYARAGARTLARNAPAVPEPFMSGSSRLTSHGSLA